MYYHWLLTTCDVRVYTYTMVFWLLASKRMLVKTVTLCECLLEDPLRITIFNKYFGMKCWSIWALLFSAQSSSSSTADCGRSYIGRVGDVGGVIVSPNFPFDYRHNLTCTFRIHVGPAIRPLSSSAGRPTSGTSARVLCMQFRRFDLETSSPFCSFDYVEIGSNPAVKYCGTGLWHNGVIDQSNDISTVWSTNFCCELQLCYYKFVIAAVFVWSL